MAVALAPRVSKALKPDPQFAQLAALISDAYARDPKHGEELMDFVKRYASDERFKLSVDVVLERNPAALTNPKTRARLMGSRTAHRRAQLARFKKALRRLDDVDLMFILGLAESFADSPAKPRSKSTRSS